MVVHVCGYGCACVSLCMLALFQCRRAWEQVYVHVCISLCAYMCVCVNAYIMYVCVFTRACMYCMCVLCVCVCVCVCTVCVYCVCVCVCVCVFVWCVLAQW